MSDSSEYDEIVVSRREETKKQNGSSNVFSGCIAPETDTPLPVPRRTGGKSADSIIYRRSAHFPEEQAIKQKNALRKSFSFRATLSKMNIFHRSNPTGVDKQEKDDNIETQILNASFSNLLNLLSYSADDVSSIGVQTLEKQHNLVALKTDSSIAKRLRSSFKFKKPSAYERSESFKFLAHSGDPFNSDFDQSSKVGGPPTNYEHKNEEEYGFVEQKPVALFFENNIYESIDSFFSESSSSYIKEMDNESENSISNRSNRFSYIINIFDTNGEKQDIQTLEESYLSDTDVRQSSRRRNGLEEVRKNTNRRSFSLTNVSTSAVLNERLLHPSRLPDSYSKSLSKCIEKHRETTAITKQAAPRYAPKYKVSPSYVFPIPISYRTISN